MSGKDEFKFDDDAFPETDLSAAFSEGEQSLPEEPEYPMTIKQAGGSRTRLLLLLLLLVVAAGGGMVYFQTMEEPPPPPKPVVATAPKPPPPPVAPAQVSVPPPPVAPAPAGAPAQVSVPPPPPPSAPAAAVPSVSVALPPPPPPAAAEPATAAVSTSAPAKPVAVPVPPPPKPAVQPPPATAVSTAAAGGPWQVEGGTYLNAAALKAAEAKIRGLGYEPRVSSSQKKVRMVRLRVGTAGEGQVKEALALVRTFVPEAFALRSGALYGIYAGTFANPENLRQLSEQLAGHGFNVVEEPVEVPQTISLVRFGGFADQAAAAEAAKRAQRAGIAAVVVKTR